MDDPFRTIVLDEVDNQIALLKRIRIACKDTMPASKLYTVYGILAERVDELEGLL